MKCAIEIKQKEIIQEVGNIHSGDDNSYCGGLINEKYV